MGFLDNKSEEEKINEALEKFNIFEGVECRVIFPNKELKISTSSGVAKGAATLAFGLVGLAATGGVKHDEQNRELLTVFQVVENGIVFKNATKDGEDLQIPYDNIVKVEVDEVTFETNITLLKNQTFILIFEHCLYSPKYVPNHIKDVVNLRACGAQYEEGGWGLEHGTAEPQETKQQSNLMDELERLANLYEKGLLTDDEFAAMKKKLIEE